LISPLKKLCNENSSIVLFNPSNKSSIGNIVICVFYSHLFGIYAGRKSEHLKSSFQQCGGGWVYLGCDYSVFSLFFSFEPIGTQYILNNLLMQFKAFMGHSRPCLSTLSTTKKL
jgi:hypothetical protein